MRRVDELRIHGVGGSPGAALLGVDPANAVVIQRGDSTQVLARAAEPQVQGYDWGRLTTDSRFQPLWVLLLPFTLANVAGWGHHEFTGNQLRVRLTRWLVHTSAILLTASYVLWAAILFADYLGYQLLGAAGQTAPGSSEIAGPAGESPGILGVVCGFVATFAVLAGLAVIADITRRRFERVQPGFGTGPRDGEAHWQPTEGLESNQFFAHDRSLKTLLAWHIGTVLLVGAITAGLAWINWGEANLGLGQAFLVVGAAQFLVIGMLAVCCWNPSGRFPGQSGPRALPAAAVTLAVALSNGVWAGLALLTAQLSGISWNRWGQELALIESFVITLLLWAVALAAWLLYWRQRGNADELPARTTAPEEQPDGVTEQLRSKVATRRGRARAAKQVPQMLSVFAGLFLLSSLITVILRLQPGGSLIEWIQPPERGALSSMAVVMLPGLAVAAMFLVWLSVKWQKLAGLVGMLWDVLTFWPRRYHPFAVRPYTERAVPEFQRLITERVSQRDGLIISAHSQGSVLAFAALAPMDANLLNRCGLLSHGSPVTTLYGQAFPAYFGQQRVESMQQQLAVGAAGWINLYRLTDEIGGAVCGPATFNTASNVAFTTAEPVVDHQLPDPAEESPSLYPLDSPEYPAAPADPEPLREPWIDLAGHGDYYAEMAYKQAIRTFQTSFR